VRTTTPDATHPAGEQDTDEPATDGQNTDGPQLSTDEAFKLLSNHRRRYAVHHLQREGDAEIGDLSQQVAAWENDTESAEVTPTERKRVYTSLQQFHLPKLDEKGVIEYDERAGEVELSDGAADLDVYLEVVRGKDIPWSEYHLGLAAVNAALLVAYATGAWPLTIFSGLSWWVFAVVATGVSAAIHTYYSRSMQLGVGESPPSHDQ